VSGFVFPGSSGGGGGVSLGSATPTAISGAVGAAGASGSASREDHAHALAFGSDADGDVPVRSGGAYGRKAAGTNGFVFTVVSGVPDWRSPIVASVGGRTGVVTTTQGNGVLIVPSGSDLLFKFGFAGQVQGDVVYFDGTNWVLLPAGTSGHFLKTNGAGANPVWAAATASVLTGGADGEVWAANGGTQAFTSSPRIGGTIVALAPTNLIQNASSQTLFGVSGSFVNVGHATASSSGSQITAGSGGQHRVLHGAVISWNLTRSSSIVTGRVDVAALGLDLGLPSTTAASTGDFTLTGQDTSNAATTPGAVVAQIGRNTADPTKVGTFKVKTSTTTYYELGPAIATLNPSLGSNNLVRLFDASVTTDGDNVLFHANGTAPSAIAGGVAEYVLSGEKLFKTPTGAVRSVVTFGSPVASGLFVATSNGGTSNRQLKMRSAVCSDGATFNVITDEV
jgi:hypothetical protein